MYHPVSIFKQIYSNFSTRRTMIGKTEIPKLSLPEHVRISFSGFANFERFIHEIRLINTQKWVQEDLWESPHKKWSYLSPVTSNFETLKRFLSWNCPERRRYTRRKSCWLFPAATVRWQHCKTPDGSTSSSTDWPAVIRHLTPPSTLPRAPTGISTMYLRTVIVGELEILVFKNNHWERKRIFLYHFGLIYFSLIGYVSPHLRTKIIPFLPVPHPCACGV